MKKRWIALGMAMMMALTGCGAAKESASDMEVGGASGSHTGEGGSEGIYEAPEPGMDKAEMSTMDMAPAEGGDYTGSTESKAASTPAPGGEWNIVVEDVETSEATDSMVAESDAVEVEVEPIINPEQQIPPAAGLLTAGEWCDNENWDFYTALITEHRFNFNVFGLMPYERVVVHAVSGGTAAKRVRAELMDQQGMVIASGVTDHNGTAYLFYNTDGSKQQPVSVVVSNADGSGSVTVEFSTAASSVVAVPDIQDVELQYPVDEQGNLVYDSQFWSMPVEKNPGVSAVVSYELTVELLEYVEPVKKLDVMFVFDTTGSMGDELRYLMTEFVDIAERAADQSTRYSANFYRDQGDAYIVRSNPFMTDVQAVSALINAETADGGGDYEEAVDLALQDAVFAHAWDAESVKLLFLILDAPPHDTPSVRENLKNVAAEAARQGIRIIPIASSGVDATTEGMLRTLAMMTGGTYTFLTDDSGIGGSHLEPTIGDYEVEALNELIIRLIQEYYQ